MEFAIVNSIDTIFKCVSYSCLNVKRRSFFIVFNLSKPCSLKVTVTRGRRNKKNCMCYFDYWSDIF